MKHRGHRCVYMQRAGHIHSEGLRPRPRSWGRRGTYLGMAMAPSWHRALEYDTKRDVAHQHGDMARAVSGRRPGLKSRLPAQCEDCRTQRGESCIGGAPQREGLPLEAIDGAGEMDAAEEAPWWEWPTGRPPWLEKAVYAWEAVTDDGFSD